MEKPLKMKTLLKVLEISIVNVTFSSSNLFINWYSIGIKHSAVGKIMEMHLSERVGTQFFAIKNLKGRDSKGKERGQGEGTAKMVGQVSIPGNAGQHLNE